MDIMLSQAPLGSLNAAGVGTNGQTQRGGDFGSEFFFFFFAMEGVDFTNKQWE